MRFLTVACALLAIVSSNAFADEDLPNYTIRRSGTCITIDGSLEEPAWVAAESVGEFEFPWWKEGKKEQTVAKLLWDDDYLYVSFLCEDGHIWAEHWQRDSEVYKDDCVELFAAPDVGQPNNYFNLEMNVRGAFLDHHRPLGPPRAEFNEWDAQGILIATSIAGSLNNDCDADRYWILEAAIPLCNYAKVARHVPPRDGDVWRINLNRCGGNTNAQYSQWSPAKIKSPNFHVPEFFGRMTFSAKPSPF